MDVMPHPGTAPETFVVVDTFAKRIGQIRFTIQRESHGYLLNAMLSAVQHEALTLVIDGGACVKGVDLLTIASDY